MDKHQQGHKETINQPQHHDRDTAHQHIAGGALCSSCGAHYKAGHWAWQQDVGEQPQKVTCPACKRIADNDPAGNLVLSGDFVQAHREDLLNLIRNTEAKEKQEHPLERLLAISEEADRVLISTTGTHLANRIGHALESAYDGCVTYSYTSNETHLDVTWRRD